MDKTQLKKEILFRVLNSDTVSKKEMEVLVARIIENILKLKESLTKEVKDTVGYTQNTSKSLETALQTLENRLIGLISKSTKESQDKAYKELNNAVYNIEKTLSELPQFDPAILEEKWGMVVADMEKSMKEMCSGEKILENVREREEGERWEITDVNNLRKELDEMKKMIRHSSGGMGGGITGRDIIKDIDISAQLDGATKTFNIAGVWNIISVNLSSFPYGSCRKNVDYTFTATTITFTDQIDAPTQLASGQSCVLTVVSQ